MRFHYVVMNDKYIFFLSAHTSGSDAQILINEHFTLGLNHVDHAALTGICHQVQYNVERANKSRPHIACAMWGNTANVRSFTCLGQERVSINRENIPKDSELCKFYLSDTKPHPRMHMKPAKYSPLTIGAIHARSQTRSNCSTKPFV